MTQQQEKAHFKQAIDHALSGIEGDPFLAQKVLARAEKGEKPVKYHIPKAVVFALIVLLCMGTVAVAAGLYGGTINWEGEIVYDELQTQSPHPSPTPRPPESELVQVDEAHEEALRLAENYAYEEARRTDSKFILYERMTDGRWKPESEIELSIETTSKTKFETMLADAPWLPLPNYIPEGYAFERADVYYTCASDGEWELVKSETINDRIRVEWYKPSKPVAMRYDLIYRASEADYHYINFFVDLNLKYEPGSATFGFSEGMAAQIVTVPGMENAIAITGERACSLSMRRPLAEALDVWYVYQEGQYPQQLADVTVDIHAPRMAISDLIPLFTTE